MSLLGLPTEMLEKIILASITEDRSFENILLACRTTYNAGKSHIDRYNRLCEWHSLAVGDGSSETGRMVSDGDFRKMQCGTTWDVLRFIDFNPEVAQVIRHLDLGDIWNLTDNGYDWSESRNLNDEELQDIERVVQKQFNSSLLKEFGDEMDLRAFSRNDAEGCGCRVVLLLGLLLNLKELTLPRYWPQLLPSAPAHIIKSIATQLRQEPSRNYLPLFRLERLRIRCRPRSEFAIVEMFLGLPSLTALHVSNLEVYHGRDTGDTFRWPVPGFSSNLREITLDSCCFDHISIGELLDHTPSLESLIYSHHHISDGRGFDWDAGCFITTIGEKRGETLKTLSVTFGKNMSGVTHQAPTFLKHFTALETLELEIDLFRAPPYCGGPMDRTHNPGGWTEIPPLADILPPSVRKLTLELDYFPHSIGPLRSLFARSSDLRDKSQFPYLERLVVRPERPGFVQAYVPEYKSQQSLLAIFDAIDVELIPKGSENVWVTARPLRDWDSG